MKTFAENLIQIRNANNLSQFQLAKLLGTTQQRISEWECGKIEPKPYYISKLCIILDTTFDELFDGVFPDLENLKKLKK